MTSVPWSSRPAALRFATILGLGVCAAAVAGAVHLGETWIAASVMGGLRWVSRDFTWMAPVSYGLLLVPAAAALAVVALVVRHRGWLAISAMGLATTAAFGVLLPYTQVSRTAALILATGIGVQVGRWCFAAPERWARGSGRLACVAVALVALAAAVQPRLRVWEEARALAALPAPPAGAPNVLLVVLDAGRAKSLGFVNPAAATTPLLDRWAASSTVFAQAYSAAPWTLPSHASMMSGQWSGELTANWTVPIARDHPVLPELLRDAGYLTSGFVANLHYTAWDSGLARGFTHYDDYQIDWPQTVRSSSFFQTNLADTLLRLPTPGNLRSFLSPDLSIVRQHRYQSRLAAEVIDAFLSWDSARGVRPYFAFVNLMDPHLATTEPDASRRRYPPDLRDEASYLEGMRYLDRELDRLLRTLRDRGSLDRTIVIVTADHGELLGEHGLEGHARSVYRDVLHVPLLVRYPPGVPAGVRIDRVVSLRDLAATIQDLTGVAPIRLPGTSLTAAWRDTTVALSAALAEVRQQPNPLGEYPSATGDLSALFDAQWYYIRNHGTHGEELFHYAADTGEVVNHAMEPDSIALLRPWRQALKDLLAHRTVPQAFR